MRRWLQLGVVLLLIAPGFVEAADELPTMAVVDWNARHVDVDTVAILSQVVTDEVDALNLWEVISAADIATMLDTEAQKQMLSCGDETSCLTEIGGALGAEYLLAGEVGRLGDTWVVSLRLLEVAEARVVRRVSQTVDGDEAALIPAARALARSLGQPEGTPAAVGTTAVAGPRARVGALPWSLWGAGALATGGGVFFGLQAQANHSVAKDQTQLLADRQTAIDDGRRQQRTANVLYISAGALAAGGVVALLLDRRAEPAAAWRVVPTTDRPGLALVGRFP